MDPDAMTGPPLKKTRWRRLVDGAATGLALVFAYVLVLFGVFTALNIVFPTTGGRPGGRFLPDRRVCDRGSGTSDWWPGPRRTPAHAARRLTENRTHGQRLGSDDPQPPHTEPPVQTRRGSLVRSGSRRDPSRLHGHPRPVRKRNANWHGSNSTRAAAVSPANARVNLPAEHAHGRLLRLQGRLPTGRGKDQRSGRPGPTELVLHSPDERTSNRSRSR